MDNQIKLLENKIMLLMASGRMDEVIEALDQIISLDPSKENIVNKASILLALDRTKDALDYLDEAIKNDPDPEYYNFKAMIQLSKGQNDDAVSILAQLIDNNPNVEATKIKASILFVAGRIDEAVSSLDSAISITPNTELYQLKFTILLSAGMKEAALDTIDELIAFDPNPEFVQLKATMLYLVGNTEEAIRVLDNAISKNPNPGRQSTLNLDNFEPTEDSLSAHTQAKVVDADTKQDDYENLMQKFKSSSTHMTDEGQESFINQQFKETVARMTDTAREEERSRILSNLSHSIKNLLRSVIDPLLNLRSEVPEKANVIDNALKGAGLIREIVNSINLSYNTVIDDLLWDIHHPGSESVSLEEMILGSVKYSISNMFDFRYFPAFAENYYPSSMGEVEFETVKQSWNSISVTDEIALIKHFSSQNLFDLEVELSGIASYRMGNEKSSAIKLMILFQEVIFNAVKYASFVPRKSRFVIITLNNSGNRILFEVQNSYRPNVQAKTTGVGKIVIENFARVLGCVPIVTTTDENYKITIEFENLWK
ncbi:MAG: tetratricopeptide repeat protein [Candidatus Subteraquimicrobiales bacterium]|nr:tetratricopeptide repeat protein [Candidatus Subteraquimicrobiales bacterium]